MDSSARFALIPPGQGRRLARRFAFVFGGSALLTAANALVRAGDGPVRFDIAAAYTFGISLLTWACIDVGRLALRRPLDARAPGYWPKSRAKAAALVLPGIVFGYLGGTALGDWVAGRSTFDLLVDNPARFYGILGASALLSFAAVAYFIQRGQSEAMARQAQQARLDLLVSQLEPHMLFNTLANLRVLIARDPGQAQAMLDRLVGYLRTTLSASRVAVHPLTAEFARCADYLALMGMRMGPRLQVRLDLPDALRECAVPTLLLQPLVENAIAHGLEPSVRGGRIEISALSPPGQRHIELRVRDTGVGLPDDQWPHRPTAGGTGYGLEHVRERLQTLYGTRASLRLTTADDAEGGTLATIVLPKHHGDLATC